MSIIILRLKVVYLLFIFALFSMLASAPYYGYSQSYLETFGQNRIQHRKFDWKYFDTKRLRVYHYDRTGKQLGRYVAEEAENDIAIVEKKLGGQFPRRFSIVLYNSYEEYRQTNIGLKEESQALENTKAGTVNLVGDKLVVYYTGKHEDLKHQILFGMAKVVMERMIFGDNLKKVVKNALLLNLPPWVTEGYIAYLVDGWDSKSSSEWKSLLDARPKARFYELSEKYPELAGKAFWKFVAHCYGNATVKNLLYSMQLKTSLNKAMKAPENLNMKVTKAYDSCIKFYKNTYALDGLKEEMPDSSLGLTGIKIPKDNTELRNITLSPRGSDVAYVTWKDGIYKVCTQRTTGNIEPSVLLEGGIKDMTEKYDPNYPLISYSNTGNKLAIMYKKGTETRLRIYNSEKGKIENYLIPKNRFDRVLGMTFMQDDDKMIFSAIKKSQTDLYIFTIKKSKMVNITDDVWDDAAPVFISGGSRTGVLFLSNRPKPNLNVPLGVNELPTGPMNVFFYNTTTGRTELLQCTHLKKGRITQPIQYGFDNFAYLYDENGIRNKYVVMFARDKSNRDSAYCVPVTNYTTGILNHQYNIERNEVADVIQSKNIYKVYFHRLEIPGVNVEEKNLSPTILSVERPEEKNMLSSNINLPENKNHDFINNDNNNSIAKKPKPEIKSGNDFISEFSDAPDTSTKIIIKPEKLPEEVKNPKQETKSNSPEDSSLLTEMSDSAFLKMKPAPYRLSFKPDLFSVRLDNSILFSQYQSFAKSGGTYNNPSMSTLTTLSLDELMENHRFTGGFQLPINLSTSAYFLQYQNFTRRLDWSILFMHTQNKESKTFDFVDASGQIVFTKDYLFKNTMDMLQGDISYPLTRVKSVKFHSAFRVENMIPKAQDSISLFYLDGQFPTQYWTFNRLEYIFDNTISPAQNIRFGTRYKVYAEYMYEMNYGKQSCYNIGLDFRTYQKLYKNMIWATRIAYAHSDGNSEVQYQLGGVDNWLAPQQAVSGTSPGNPGFIALTTNLRGYKQNARKGNNFAVINTEFRLPILTTFIKRPIQSSILKNLQFVTFVDAGSAWNGFLPTADNTSATYFYPTNIGNVSPTGNIFLSVTVPDAYGLAVGYGCGLRTSLFGYFLRIDAASSIDTPKQLLWYFSLGTDF